MFCQSVHTQSPFWVLLVNRVYKGQVELPSQTEQNDYSSNGKMPAQVVYYLFT